MPMVRYQIRSEYGLADPEVYRAAEKDDPEALLEGVAMAGLVGVLRQLGDLADFAAEVFHDLHEEVMATSARGHVLMHRVQQLEAEFPSAEKALHSQTDHSHYAYSIGIEWHANHRMDQNLVTQGDMPRCILDSYEECRGPPRLFMLDKFDVAGAGACLKRYSDPSFFKTESATFEMMEAEVQWEKRNRKFKKKGSRWKSETGSFFAPFMENPTFNASGQATEKILARCVRLKHRNSRVAYISRRKKYLEGLLKGCSFDRNDLKSSFGHSVTSENVDPPSKVLEFSDDGVTNSSAVRKELPSSLVEVTGELENHKTDGEDLMETTSTLFGLSEVLPTCQHAEQGSSLVGVGDRVDCDAFNITSKEADMTPTLQLAKKNKLSADTESLTDEHDGYRSDDIGSELENYVDALYTIESETETDSENRAKSGAGLLNNSQSKNPDISRHLQLQTQFYGSAYVGSFSTSATSEEIKDEMPTLSQSRNLVDLPNLQLLEKIVSEDISRIEISQSDTEKQVGIEDSALNSKWNFEESQAISAHSTRSFSDSTFEGNEHRKPSFHNWQTNEILVLHKYEEHPNNSYDVLEELDHTAQCDDRISANITNIHGIPCYLSETEVDVLAEKVSSEFSKYSLLTLMNDEIDKPREILEPDSNNCPHDNALTTLPMGLTIVESENLSNGLHIDMQSDDLTKEVSFYNMESSNEVRKHLNSFIEYPAEKHELPLLANDVIASPEFPENTENFIHDLASLSDERGSRHGSQDYSVKDQSSRDRETLISSDLAYLYVMPETLQTQAENSVLLVSTVHVEDSLNDLMEENNETYTIQKQFPAGTPELPLLVQDANVSYGSTEIYDNLLLSSVLISDKKGSSHGSRDDSQKDHFSADKEEVTPSDMTISRQMSEYPQILAESSLPEVSTVYVSNSLHDSMVKDNEACYVEKLSPTSSFSHEICSSIEQSEISALEMKNISLSEEDFQHPQSPESCGNFDVVQYEFVTYAIPSDLEHFSDAEEIQESADMGTVESIRSYCRKDLDANQLQPEVPDLIKNDGIEHFNDALQFANRSTDFNLQYDQQPVEENMKDSNLLDKIIIPDDVDGMLKSSIVSSFDAQLQDNVVSEDATFYKPEPEVEELPITKESTYLPSENNKILPFTQNEDLNVGAPSGCQSSVLDLSITSDAKLLDANSVNIHSELYLSPEQKRICSKENEQNPESLSENVINKDGTDDQVLCQLQSSSVSSFDLQFQEDEVSEGDSLNERKSETEEQGNTNDIISLRPTCNLFLPLTMNDDEDESVSSVLSSHLVPNLSTFPDTKLLDVDFDDSHVVLHPHLDEENSICMRDDAQSYHSYSSALHVMADLGKLEILSEQASVTQSLSLQSGGEDIEPTGMHSNVVCFEETRDFQITSNQEEQFPSPQPGFLFNNDRKSAYNIPSSRTDEGGQTEIDASVMSKRVFEHPTSSMAFEALDSGSLPLADSIITDSSLSMTLPDETISGLQIQKEIAEAPSLPPLPPLQWRMGKPHLGSLVADGSAAQHVLETNPSMLLSASKVEMDQHAHPSESTLLEELSHEDSLNTDGEMTVLKLSELPPIIVDERQELVIQFPEGKAVHPLDHSLFLPSNNDDNGTNPFSATSFEDVKHQELKSGNPFTTKERRPQLVDLLPGLQLDRLQETPIIDKDLQTSNSFLVVSSAGNGKYQYGYGDCIGYGNESMEHQSFSAPFTVPFHSILPHYSYHMYLREGNSSSMYDIMLSEMEGDRPNGKPSSIRNRPRDPLIEAVAAHDKSTLRKVSEIDRSLTKPKEDERNHLLEQIKNKSFNLKPATSAKRNIVKAPQTNLKVAAILEKANAIRQACIGSDEDNDDNWSDS